MIPPFFWAINLIIGVFFNGVYFEGFMGYGKRDDDHDDDDGGVHDGVHLGGGGWGRWEITDEGRLGMLMTATRVLCLCL